MYRLLVSLIVSLLAFAAATSVAAAPPGDPGDSEEILVRPGMSLQQAIEAAPPHATLRLTAGRHEGPVVIEKPLSLVGDPDALVIGTGEGSVITINSADVRVEGLEISGSGKYLPDKDSGILVNRTAPRALIRSNSLHGNLVGVYLHGSEDSLVEDNDIVGRDDVRLSEAGNGVSIWNSPGAKVVGNRIRQARDGIFVNVSKNNVFKNNDFSDLRFAIHYMYTHDSKVIGNRSRDNHVGWAIMYSERLEIRDNVSEDDRDHGLLLNTANRSRISGNIVRRGREKCVFMYNANRNVFTDNWFEGCPIGIHFTAGSEGNTMTGNAFIRNRSQVKYVGTRYLDWTHEGRGNYWSDNPAFDLDGDGIADRPYRPNDILDEILWTLPQAKVLINSPAVAVVRWAQSRFPAVYPGGVVDTAPLMQPPSLAAENPS